MSKMGEEAVGGGRTRRAVMVTALPVEYEAVCEHLTDLQEDEHAQGDVYERGLLAAEGQTWEVGVVEIGAGNPNAAMKTERAIAHFQPEVVVFVGVAGGLKDVQIGDVVVATKVYGYHAGKAEAEFKTRPEVGQPTHRMAERARAEARKEEWLKRLAERGQPIPTPRPHVFLGPIAAGEQVVVSKQSQTYQLIRASYGDALAVEMEGYGFLKATHATSNVEALVVRGISDLVEGKTEADEGGSQPRAARHAAAFAFQVLAKLAPAPSPHSFATDTRQQQGRPVTPSAVKGHSTLPYQPTFFGRRKERQIIAEAIDPDARGWGVLIDGPGGIGKTALAIQAGHDAPAAHFPRKIFLSAKARELTPAGPQPLEDFQLPNYLALLTELAREVGEEQIAQLEPAERPSAVRRALADQRALIVIDNVETLPEAERVRLYQFLSRLPPSCKAIVTSRRRSDIDARVIRLDRLERPDALALMAELAKNNRALARATAQEREDFYEITGGNPLLIQWVAGQLGRPGSQCRTIAAACEYMQSAPPDNDPLEFIFGDLLD
ncbi:MAG: AAA family ATPase, partial [Chloroflexota bacterium]